MIFPSSILAAAVFAMGFLSTLAFGIDSAAKRTQFFPAADPHVMAALGADVEIAFELSPIQHRVARRTLDP